MSLAEAREHAVAARAMLREGKDPVADKTDRRVAAMLTSAKAMTFAQAATAYIELHTRRLGLRIHHPVEAEAWPRMCCR